MEMGHHKSRQGMGETHDTGRNKDNDPCWLLIIHGASYISKGEIENNSAQQPPALSHFSAVIYSLKIVTKTKQNKNKGQNLSQCLLLPEMLKHFLHFQDKWYEMKT